MRAPKAMFSSAVAAAVLAAAGQAHAQQDQEYLSAEAVRSFLEEVEQDATQLVRAGDYPRLLDWVEDNLSDESVFFVSEALHVGDRRKGFAVVTLDKKDILRLSRAAVGMMSAMPDQALQDYSLEIEVIDVDPIGPNAAAATTRIVESGRFVLSGGASGGAAQASGTAGAEGTRSDPIEIEATAECSHLIRRSETGEQLLLGMTACDVAIRL